MTIETFRAQLLYLQFPENDFQVITAWVVHGAQPGMLGRGDYPLAGRALTTDTITSRGSFLINKRLKALRRFGRPPHYTHQGHSEASWR